MIATVLATAAIALLAMLPGPLLLRGTAPRPGQWAAAATASLTAMMLATALLGALVSLFGLGLPAVTIVPVSLAAYAAGWFATRGRKIGKSTIEWHGLALAAVFSAYGLLCQFLAVHEDAAGALTIHTWYNADWFKHLGHVAALADYGVPARDAFNSGEPLYYYWLSYLLPGAGAALGGDNWAALTTANVIITALFSLTFYGTVRLAGAGPRTALLVAFLCLFICSPINFAWSVLTGPEGLAALFEGDAPGGPAIAGLSRYIPQHTLALGLMVSWFVLNRPDARPGRAAQLLMLAALASVMAISTLLGAMVLSVYGLVVLWERRLAAVPELAAMALLSGLLVLALGVIQFGNPNSAIDSPLLTNALDAQPWFARAGRNAMLVIVKGGLPFLIGLALLYAWRAGTAYAFRIAVVLYGVTLASVVAVELVLPPRAAIEALIRVVHLPAIAFALASGWALPHLWSKGQAARVTAVAATAVLTLLTLPTIIVQTIGFGRTGDGLTTTIPREDLEALAWLRANTPARAIVWQYPEPPFLADPSGGDAWATVFGGRTVTGSLRATDYASSAPRIEAAKKYFAGENLAIPADVGWIYLSRALHPESYDLLLARLGNDAKWRKRRCLQDACLFERRDAAV